MSHLEQKRFCLSVREQYPVFFQEKLVLDVGSLDINGSNRFLFQSCNYVGVDLMPGENVDFVSKAHELKLPDSSFDTIISTECFEHDKFYRESIINIIRMLKPGGMFVFTCATTGRPEHGTKRTTPDDAPFLESFGDWEDYYKNLTEADITNIVDINSIFDEYQFSINEETHDLRFVGIKSGELINQNNTFSESKVTDVNSKLTTQIVELETQIEKRDEIIQSNQDSINEVSAWGKSLEQQLKQQTESMNTLNQVVEKRDGNIQSNQDSINEVKLIQLQLQQQTENVNTLNQAVEKRDEELQSYKKEFNKVSSSNELIQLQLDQQTDKIKALNQAVEMQDEQLLRDYNHLLNTNHLEMRSMRAEDIYQQGQEVNTLIQAVEKRNEEIQFHQGILENVNKEYSITLGLLRMERLTIFKPIYRNIYKYTGLILRKTLPVKMVEYIKRNFVPFGDRLEKMNNFSIIKKDSHNLSGSFLTPSLNSDADVFIFSIINFDFRYQRPQHIAEGLSKLGRRVFYIEMTLTDSGEHEISKISKNLYTIRISNKKIGHIQAYNGKPNEIQITEWIKAIYQICNIVNSTNLKDVIIQHPFWWQLTQYLPPEFRITYDCMDDIAGFSNTDDFLLDLEHDLLKNCDNLVVSSQFLFDKYKKFNAPNLVRNGADVSNFDIHKEHADFPDLHHFPKTNSKSIKVGYVGAIADWFDVDLVREVALQNIDFEFHLCGAVSVELQQLKDVDNIHLYGEIPYSNVAGFIQEMDVLTIPFKLVPIIQACDPVKFYEYSAMEKPTVSTNLPELKRASEITFVAKDADEFGRQIRHANTKSKDIVFTKKLSAYATDNTWNDRSESFNNSLKDVEKVSVVILSYGDPELTKNALYSLFDDGRNYPNLEVIIVDNGSSQEDIDDITDFAEEYRDTRIIKNAENLGFAKGNNVGISASTGKYVLLLNNDTFVPSGAILSMVNHLANNPKIGVVGPLTNNIGNEAKLFVDYDDMDQMKNVARSATTGYRGQFSPIDVVAYFAVMFRKSDLDKFGLLSEDYGRGMFEDDDHCQVIKSHGYICALAEDAFVHHHLSASFSKINDDERNELFNKNKVTFEKKWGKWKPHEYRDSRPNSKLGIWHGK